MTHTELKQVILEYIRELYNKEYIGELKIENLDPIGYKISFNFNRAENPLVIISDLPDLEFIPFIKEEIRKSNFIKTRYYKLHKLYPHYLKLCK